MSDDILAYFSVFRLNRNDIKFLGIRDTYSLHKQVYDLFEDIRTEADKINSKTSGFLWENAGNNFNSKEILILSNRKPNQTPKFGKVETKIIKPDFLNYSHYGFEVTINPVRRIGKTRKNVAIKNSEDVAKWFIKKAKEGWGFEIEPEHLEVNMNSPIRFKKKGNSVLLNSAKLKGKLKVIDKKQFAKSFLRGIGKGKSFGFGFLKIVPVNH